MVPIAEWHRGVIHGVVIRHHGRNQEEVEEELGEEVKGTGGRERSNTSAHDLWTMDEMERTLRGPLEPM